MLTTEPYDPDTPEGAPSKSGLVTGKELRSLVLLFVGLFGLLTVVYFRVRENGFREICQQNMKAVADAVNAYCDNHEGFYPLPFHMSASGIPQSDHGAVISWVTTVQPYMNARKSFVCPAADEKSLVKSALGGGKVVLSSYGLVPGVICQITPEGRLAPMRKDDVADAANVALLTETDNFGAESSRNPVPWFESETKPFAWDGFLVGYQYDNLVPDVEENGKVLTSEFVTRLARKGDKGRHEFNFVIFANGNRGKLVAGDQAIPRDRDHAPIAPWWPTNNRQFIRK